MPDTFSSSSLDVTINLPTADIIKLTAVDIPIVSAIFNAIVAACKAIVAALAPINEVIYPNQEPLAPFKSDRYFAKPALDRPTAFVN